MAELTLWLIAVGVGDLVMNTSFSRRLVPALIAASMIAAVTGYLLGVSWPWMLVASSAAGVWLVLRGVGRRCGATVALVTFAGLTAVLALVSRPVGMDAPLQSILTPRSGSLLFDTDPALLVLLFGCVLAMTATGNALVRAGLLLAGTGEPGAQGEETLRAGRVIGTLERLLILGFAFSGHPTAAALVISAKGLLRFRELNEKQHSEYVLVGSLLSWTVALAGAAVLQLLPEG